MSAINSSKISGSSLDVASIVSQLMEVERKPLNLIANKIERAQVKISALGTFQSKLSALKDAIDKLQRGDEINIKRELVELKKLGDDTHIRLRLLELARHIEPDELARLASENGIASGRTSESIE
jgi:hypothetical protein